MWAMIPMLRTFSIAAKSEITPEEVEGGRIGDLPVLPQCDKDRPDLLRGNVPHVHVKILNPRGADLVQGPGGGERPHGPEGRTPFVHLDGEPFRPRTHDFPSPDPTGGDHPRNREGGGGVGHREPRGRRPGGAPAAGGRPGSGTLPGRPERDPARARGKIPQRERSLLPREGTPAGRPGR